MSTWYQKCMPKIIDIKHHLKKITTDIRKINGINSVYVWGSYLDNINKPNFRVKDIDIIAKTNYDAGDLIAINNNVITKKYSQEYLEEQGYNPQSIQFSKDFINFKKYNIDHWAISSNNKLLHWGPIMVNKKESDDINKEAEKYASKKTGYNRKKINVSSELIRNNWYKLYSNYLNKYFSDMPSGWYQTDEVNIKNILTKAKKM